MVDVLREIERKYEAGDGRDPGAPPGLPDLAGLPGVASVTEAEPFDLDATYYDTEDLRLATTGATLRRRTGGGDAGWHLKLPADPHDPGVRDEFREPPADETPPALTSLLRSRLRAAHLVPLMRLRQRRTVRRLLAADGALLAEVGLDEVRAERYGPGGRAAAWTEIEAELGQGQDPALLDAIEARLTAEGSGVRRSTAPSKLRRALTETAPGGPGAAGPAPGSGSGAGPEPRTPATAGDVALRYVRAQVRVLVETDPAVRRDLPDSVHRMRVATRRLRGAFRTHGQVLDRTVTDPLGAELAWLAGELGIDRDQEVLTQRLTARLDELPRALRLGPVRGRLVTFSHARRRGSRRRLLAVLDGARHLALLEALDALLAHPPLRAAAARPPEAVVARAVRRDHERLARHVGEALAARPGPERDLALHEARKCAKRVRYAAESARPVFGGAAKRFAARIAELQEVLGEHQDSVLTRAALRDLARQAHAAGEPSFTYGVLHEREAGRAAEAEATLPLLWSALLREPASFP